MKLSSNPAMWGNLKSINALMTKDSVRHKKNHVTEKFSMKDVKPAISICTGPKSILQVKQGVQIVLFSIMAYPNWVINWFFNDLFKGSPPYFSNIETKMLNPLVKVSNIRQTIPAVTWSINLRTETLWTMTEGIENLHSSYKAHYLDLRRFVGLWKATDIYKYFRDISYLLMTSEILDTIFRAINIRDVTTGKI